MKNPVFKKQVDPPNVFYFINKLLSLVRHIRQSHTFYFANELY